MQWASGCIIWRVLSQNGLSSICVNLRYLRLKLLKNKENNKQIRDTFDHNFKKKYIYLHIMC